MSLDKYLSKSIKLNDDRVNHCLNLGQQGEDLFRQLTQAIKTDVAEDKQHIDFDWDGKKIDVKGLKPMHKQGYILLEFLNVWGYHGWCAKESKADYIAFQFPEAFYVFKKEDLRARAIHLCEKFSEDTILRKNRVKPYDGLGKWIGRYGKKDVFTYLRFVDVKDLIYDTIMITKKKTRFELDFLLPKPPSLNTVYAGKHYAVRQKYKKDYFEQIREVFQQIDEFRAETFQLHLWHNTRLDCDNLILAIKFLSDFLVAEEMVANDNKKHFKKLSISVAEDEQEVPKNFIKVKLILGNYESNN